MRQQVAVAVVALLLGAVFLAVWALELPGAPAIPFGADAGITPPAPATPTVTALATPTAAAAPTPTATPSPPPASAATATPAPTRPAATPTRRPTATPASAATPTPLPPAPTPTATPFFLHIREPADYAVIHEDMVTVVGATLPLSVVSFTYSIGAEREQEVTKTARARADGSFSSPPIPLIPGNNVIQVIGYDTAANRTEQDFVLVAHNPTPPTPAPMFIRVDSPKDGAVVERRQVTISGATLPGAQVVINDIIPVTADGEGRWQTAILLRDGENTIVARAAHDGRTDETRITITYAAP